MRSISLSLLVAVAGTALLLPTALASSAEDCPVRASPPIPSLTLTVEPQVASTTPFSYRSVVDPGGGRLASHGIQVSFTSRSGNPLRFLLAYGEGEILEGSWILRNSEINTGSDDQKVMDRVSFRGYTGSDGRVYSAGGYAPGVYEFQAFATVCYRPSIDADPEYVGASAKQVRASFYAGLTRAVDMVTLFAQAQRLWMGTGGILPGTVEGPYGDRDRRDKPWIAGILRGFQAGGSLDAYFQGWGRSGGHSGGLLGTVYEAYDPEWILGGKEQTQEHLDFVKRFVADTRTYYGGVFGLFSDEVRFLSRVFFPGDYEVGGVILFTTPHRDYLFFSRTGRFADDEDLLALELPQGIVRTMLSLMMWGEMRHRLPQCTPSGCPKPKDEGK